MFMWLGFKGIRSCIRNQHDQIFIVSLLGYLVVGTGSFLFHSTLKCEYLPLREEKSNCGNHEAEHTLQEPS
jgi:hypothetical protein